MELWELAAATGNYLGPTPEEEKIEAMYAQEAELRAAMIARQKRKLDPDYDSQHMADVKVR